MLEAMFVPPSSGRKRSIEDAYIGSGGMLDHPGIPHEVWTPKAHGRFSIYTSGAMGSIGIFFALATWHLSGMHIEGPAGLVAYLSFLAWIAFSAGGLLTGIISAFSAEDEDRKVAILLTAVSAASLCFVYLLHP